MIHLDLDCLETSVGKANDYALPGGFTIHELDACMRNVTARLIPEAVIIASFDPELVGSNAIAGAGIMAVQTITRAG